MLRLIDERRFRKVAGILEILMSPKALKPPEFVMWSGQTDTASISDATRNAQPANVPHRRLGAGSAGLRCYITLYISARAELT